jgi:hypothetical protein
MENQLHRKLDYYKEQHELSQKELVSLEKRIEEMGSMSKIHREEAIEIEKLIDHLRDRAQRDLDCEKEISEYVINDSFIIKLNQVTKLRRKL